MIFVSGFGICVVQYGQFHLQTAPGTASGSVSAFPYWEIAERVVSISHRGGSVCVCDSILSGTDLEKGGFAYRGVRRI